MKMAKASEADLKMTKKRVAELEGAQLDWAVAMAAGEHLSCDAWQEATKPGTLPFVMVGAGNGDKREYYPSSSWCQGGPIIDRENIWLAAPTGVRTQWSASVGDATDAVRGHTPLIAAMRAFVASKLCDDEVEVPE